MHVLRTSGKIGLALLALLLAAAALVTGASGQRTTVGAEAASSTLLEIILELDDDTIGVGDAGTWLPVTLQNVLQDVGGFEIWLMLDRPDLFRFASDTAVETTIVCIDTSDCDPADTIIDTVDAVPVDTAGLAVSGWEYVEGRALSSISLNLVGIADAPGGIAVAPLPAGGQPVLLLRVFLEKIASADLLDTLTDRTTTITIVANQTTFSTPDGQVIGRLDSVVCLDPPQCDSLDTVFYNDPTAIILVPGSRTFSDACTKGDVNETGTINSADIIYLVNYVFKGGPEPLCSRLTGDVNCTGTINSSDIIFLVNYVFKGGPPPESC